MQNEKVDVARANISLDDLRHFPVPLPELPEQHQVVREVDRHFSLADSAEKAVDESLAKAEHLRQSILKQAFEGKLVPQDPNDEPAEKLRERIRAARSHSARSTRRKDKGED